MSTETNLDFDRAANCMLAWILDHCSLGLSEELCEVHPDVFKEAAEVAVRAARGEQDTRPESVR